jgi:hypothetical protein
MQIEIHDVQLMLTTYFIFMLGLTSNPATSPLVRKGIQVSNVFLACFIAWVVMR